MEPESNRAKQNRRKDPRLTVDEPASLMLVHQGAAIPCRLVDLSLGGCQIRSQKPFLAGPMVRIEVVFRIVGETFRIAGVTQWTRQREWIGVRFLDVSERKRAALGQLIDEIAEQSKRRNQAGKQLPGSETGAFS